MVQYKPKKPDYDACERNSFNRQRVMHTLEISIADLSPGRIVLEMAHQDTTTQRHGFFACRKRVDRAGQRLRIRWLFADASGRSRFDTRIQDQPA